MTVRVLVHASDPVNRAGVAALLRPAREVELVIEGEESDIVVLAESTVAAAQLEEVDRLRTTRRTRCVVVAGRFAEKDLMTAVRCGVVSVLPFEGVSATKLLSTIVGVGQGRSVMPHRLQAALLRQLNELRRDLLTPNGLTLSGLDERELDVLGLIAEGFRTDEIAAKLSYSEGTVKSVLHGAMTRLNLANRAHAVAYAIRAGLL
ncbi:helix-turn-helix transcriptional regulator [Actinophytocola oryzae]|uniref:DNA-binding NarL/FixJ family response regulator n=1 Tax=Actinophytocola oryzae TaxID=502181 RepID=A0A4R7VQX6_9PSEU|nr:LuxR C-terminal-related transcriptional regulator [Actinophytocola oryzae]TDV52042.1 DNA-binding NarL/FixJ family response regulator [Actinophytocola oryzae]